MRARGLVPALVGAALGLALARPVCAADGDEAARLARAGAAATAAGRYAAAVQALEESYERARRPESAFLLADAYRLLYFVGRADRHLERAAALFRVYLDAAPTGAERGRAAEALAQLEPLRQLLEARRAMAGPLDVVPETPPPRPTLIIVLGDTPDATGSIDGGPAVRLPAVAPVAPGRHRVQVGAPSFAPASVEVEAPAHRVSVVELPLTPRPASLGVDGPSGATVWIDGRRIGRLPLDHPAQLAAGEHRVEVGLPGHRPWSRELELGRGQTLRLSVDLEQTAQRITSYWVIGAGGAALGAAGVFALMALSDDQSATLLLDQRDVAGLSSAELERYDALALRRDSRGTAALALAGVGASVLATGVLLYAVQPVVRSGGAEALSFGAAPLDGGVAVAVGGGF